MESMRGEAVLSGFRDVFDFILKKSSAITDDAVLHILIDILENYLAVHGPSFISSVGVLEFLENVGQPDNIHDPTAVVFGLNICTWLGAEGDRFHLWSAAIERLISRVQAQVEASSSQNVSIMTALYKCLGKLAKHEQGLKYICLEYKGLVPTCFALLEAGLSVFLEKCICELLASLAQAAPGQCDFTQDLSDLHSSIADKCCSALHRHVAGAEDRAAMSPRRPTAVLNVLDKIVSSPREVGSQLVNSATFVEDMLVVYYRARGSEIGVCLRILQKVDDGRVDNKVLGLAESLWREGEVIKSLKLVAKICTRTESADQCHEMLVAPLHLVTGSGRGTEWAQMLGNQNMSKAKLQDILCTALSCISQTKLREGSLVCEVLHTTDDPGPGEAPATGTGTTSKLQRTCLQYCLDNTEWMEPGDIELLLPLLVKIIGQTNVDSVTYSLGMKCIQRSLPLWLQAPQCGATVASLATVLQRHLCSLHWETRDTTVEFLGQVVNEYRESSFVVDWLRTNGLHMQVWQCLRDGESYVRASAITALWNVYTCGGLWTALCDSLGQTEETTVGVIASVLTSDSEAFARRSAARFLSSYLLSALSSDLAGNRDPSTGDSAPLSRDTVSGPSSGDSAPSSRDTVWDPSSPVLLSLLKATVDFDWDVKLCALEFIDSVVQAKLPGMPLADVPDYAKGLIQGKGEITDCQSGKSDKSSGNIQTIHKLYELGMLTNLVNTLDDYDEKVCEKASEVMSKCKEKFCEIFGQQCDTPAEVENMFLTVLSRICSQSLLERDTAHNGRDSSQVLPKDSIDGSQTVVMNGYEHENGNKRLKLDTNVEHVGNAKLEETGRNSLKELVSVVCAILKFDTEVYRSRFESATDYYANPLSLIQDILSYGKKDEEDNLVDCY